MEKAAPTGWEGFDLPTAALPRSGWLLPGSGVSSVGSCFPLTTVLRVPDGRSDIQTLFEQALELDAVGRESLLADVAEHSPTLAEEVRSLLEAHDARPDFLDDGIDDLVSRWLAEDGASPQGRVGSYEIVRELGRGGMGVVCLARRIDGGFDQQVAIKFARVGLSAEHMHRFAAEREILARLKHPGIAHLYGGGISDGRPYLVMEYVEGRAITTYCEEEALTVEQRVDLIMAVCDAVQYAHQNLVIHRDLKPSNILVTDEGRVKLLDFGIAKLLRADPGKVDAPQTLPALTPGYSSPEQLRNGVITTASDVFSLGVTAYELLAGERPFAVSGLSAAEVERLIGEENPPPPSRLARKNGLAAVDHDLDRIVMLALRKEPRERYESARALADDLKRYLRGRPVVARTPTRRYRALKFVRRNRVAVTAVLVGLSVLLAGVSSTTWQAQLASERAEEAAQERDNAQAAAERAEKINGFLQGVLATANPSWYVDSDLKGPGVTVLEALEEAARRMDEELVDDPVVRADIHHTLGDTYRALLNHEGMVRHFEASLALRREAFSEPHPKIAEGLFYLAVTRSRSGAWATGDSLLSEAIAMQRLRDEGNNLTFMLQSAAGNRATLGDLPEAIALLQEATDLAEARYPPGHLYYAAVASTRSQLALIHAEQGSIEEARRWTEAAATILGEQSAAEAGYLHALGILHAWDQQKDAEELLERSIAVAPTGVATRLDLVRYIYLPSGRWAHARSAVQAAQETLEEQAEGRPVAQQQMLEALAASAYVEVRAGRTDRAAALAENVLSEFGQLVSPADTAYLWTARRLARAALARVHLARGQPAQAAPLLLANYDAVDGRSIRGLAWFEVNDDLVALYDATGDQEAMERHAAILQGLGLSRPRGSS